MTKIKKGTLCFMSELGHYNFRYPDKEKIRKFIKDCEVKVLAYVGGGNFVAIEVETENLNPDSSISNILAVVWVRPKDLL